MIMGVAILSLDSRLALFALKKAFCSQLKFASWRNGGSDSLGVQMAWGVCEVMVGELASLLGGGGCSWSSSVDTS